MARDSFDIGPFTILEAADRGGMAEVWKGVHRAQRVPVALKVLTGPDASHPNFLAAFRNEIVAVAGLDHPNIVHVYDHGVIDADIERRSDGRLSAGCPFFVMEWASAGNLAVGARPTTWRQFRDALVDLLDALGHAHARGVIHRDLKRQNVLMCGPNDLRPGWKLADFGMARPPGIEADPLAGGTPGLMSPEQADGRWRDQGPWTDLYALGCLSWVMVTGKRGQLMPPSCEVMDNIPARTQIAVPKGIWRWIARLTEPNPQDRPQFAAQARAWLLGLGDPDAAEEAAAVEAAEIPEEPETNSDPTNGRTNTVILVAMPGPQRARPTKSAADMRVPIPVDWRAHAKRGSSLRLHGAGLSLFGLRHLPLVGREEERDRLWEGLCAVASTGRPRATILRGAAGTGKSRLVRWLAWQAHEVGAAVSLWATHEVTPGPTNGIGPMLSRYLGCAGLTRDEVLLRLEDLVADGIVGDPADVGPLLDLIAPDPEGRFEGADRQHRGREAARRLIAAHAHREPRIVWLDDVQNDGASIEFACRLLETNAPIYVVVSVRDEDLVSRAAVGARLVELARHADVSTLDVSPLRGPAWRAMVREILGLEGALAAQLEERAGGNPLFAVHLVGDWVARGLLVPGEGGFRLAPRVKVEFPDNMHAVWRAHLDALLAGRPTDEATALEIAAVLGQDVSTAEWTSACATAGLRAPMALVDTLVARRLARTGGLGGEGRWAFVHAMLRESLVRRAQVGGRLEAHHRVCAEMLAGQGHQPSIVERRARHLAQAGALAEALGPLLDSARARLAAGERDPAAALVAECVRAADLLGLPVEDPARLEVALLRAELAGLRGDAAEEARVAGDAAREVGPDLDAGLAARIFLRLGLGLRERGELRDALAALTRGAELAVGPTLAAVRATCLAERARVRTLLGEEGPAFADLAESERFFRGAQDSAGVATALLGLAAAARHQGAMTRAGGCARTALGHVELAGGRRLLGEVLVELGEVARGHGDLTAAEGWYRTAIERARLAGTDAIAARLGVALTQVERGACGAAMGPLVDLLDEARGLGRRLLMVRIRLGLLVCAAKAGEWTLWDEQVAAIRADLRGTGLRHPDVRTLLRRAAALAIGSGEAGRAAALNPLTPAAESSEPTALSA